MSSETVLMNDIANLPKNLPAQLDLWNSEFWRAAAPALAGQQAHWRGSRFVSLPLSAVGSSTCDPFNSTSTWR